MKKRIDWLSFVKEHADVVEDPELRSFYQSQNFPHNLPINQSQFVALDFETTGLDSDNDEIVSVGLVPFDLNRIYWRQSKEWLVRPLGDLSHDSVVIHGITDQQVSQAPLFSDILSEILEHLTGKIVVVHYRFIERDFLYNAVTAIKKEPLMFPVIDTLSIEADLLKRDWRCRLKQLLFRQPASVRLPNCRERYGLPRYLMHSARIDALATAELFQAQVAHHLQPDAPVAELFI